MALSHAGKHQLFFLQQCIDHGLRPGVLPHELPLKLADGVLVAAHEILKVRVRQVHPHPQAPPAAQEHLLRPVVPQGIRQLVDSVGGVTVTPDASFSGFTAGQPVTLTGQRTENYIRYRADSTEGNNQRMQRQKQVVLALVNKMLAQVKEDPASVLALYNDVRRNITTNINTAMMVYLAQQASGMHFSGGIVNVPGTSVMGAQKHAEYQVDPDALLEMVLDIFYEPVDG